MTLTHRLARRDDLDALRGLIDAAISELQKPFLDDSQIASSRTIMGLDTQLIDDGTYFIVEADGELAGCGGWSRRATLYGGDQSPGRSAVLLDHAMDPARVRAMYTHPHHTRRGVGRLILFLCEDAARSEGFKTMELMATMAGDTVSFLRFQRELANLYERLQGLATLESHEPELKVEVRALGVAGQMEVRVEITPDQLNQNHRFTLAVDQSYLPDVIRGCELVLRQYPVRDTSARGN